MKVKLDFDIGYWRRKWSEKPEFFVISYDVAIADWIQLYLDLLYWVVTTNIPMIFIYILSFMDKLIFGSKFYILNYVENLEFGTRTRIGLTHIYSCNAVY